MYNVIYYEVLTSSDDLYMFTSEKRLSSDEIAAKIGIEVDDLVQVDFWNIDDL